MQTSITERLIELYNQADETTKSHGIGWYALANKRAKELCLKHNKPMYIVAGIIVALSPNNKWERNLIDADKFLASPSLETKVCTFMKNREKALKIMKAKNAHEVLHLLNGRKTVSFYHNIMRYKTSQVVMVDLWMFRIASLTHNAKNYELISQGVLDASKHLGILPHQLQAIVWSVVRPSKGV